MPGPTETKKVELKLDFPGTQQFRWQTYFNRFSVETLDTGKLVCFAFYDGKHTPEIVPIFITEEGLKQLYGSTSHYLPALVGTPDPPADTEVVPFSPNRVGPVLCNQIRLARSGGAAEIVFATTTLTNIADVVNGLRKPGDKVNLVPVALLHSTVAVHYRFLQRVLDGVEP